MFQKKRRAVIRINAADLRVKSGSFDSMVALSQAIAIRRRRHPTDLEKLANSVVDALACMLPRQGLHGKPDDKGR
jgi:hypothetical protein